MIQSLIHSDKQQELKTKLMEAEDGVAHRTSTIKNKMTSDKPQRPAEEEQQLSNKSRVIINQNKSNAGSDQRISYRPTFKSSSYQVGVGANCSSADMEREEKFANDSQPSSTFCQCLKQEFKFNQLVITFIKLSALFALLSLYNELYLYRLDTVSYFSTQLNAQK